MDKQALKPSNLFREFTSVPKEVEKKEFSDDDKALSYLGGLKGWKLLSEYADGLCEELDSLVTKSIENGASSREIGERTVAKEIAKAYVKRIIRKVRDAREAVARE